MSSITIYVEGGGEGANGRAALRRGFAAFLDEQKRTAQGRRWRWKLACVGSREEAFSAFQRTAQHAEADVVVLLVDAEGPLQNGPLAHLRTRDGWSLDFADEQDVHLMVQTMEAWIAADPDALATYYGQGFHRNSLPVTHDLESVPKRDIERSLKAATRRTTKGEYHKIRHASELLKRIDPNEVRDRCAGCRRLLDYLSRTLA